MPKLSDADVKAILNARKTDALGTSTTSELNTQRQNAMSYYLGDMSDDLPTIEGRSQAVSTDVADTVEGLMPSLMEIFAGNDEVVRFDPVSSEDVEAAQQETDYCNYVFMQMNHGFMVLYHMIKDALLSKVGIAKVWWEEKEAEDRDTYYDQSEDAYALVMSDPNVEVIAHSEKDGQVLVDPMSGQKFPTKLHDFTIKTKRDESHCCVEPVPPEEFGISRRARYDIQAADYLYHEVIKSQSDLLDQGYDIAQVDRLASYTSVKSGGEEFKRDTVNESQTLSDESLNRAMRSLRVTEHYIKFDYEGDGIARRYRVVTGGEDNTILHRDGEPEIEEVDFWPFASMTPIPQPHRFFGRSVAEVVMDIQRIKTALTRALLDNAYLANNPRIEVPEAACTPETFDDLLGSRPGGIVRTANPGMLNVIATPPIGGHVFPLMQYFDSTREWRTGVTRQGQGLDANALQNQTATAAMQLYDAAQARMKLIARIFAETGVCDLFWLIHSTVRKYGDQARTVKLRNRWVTVDPREWKERKDMTIEVGLGTGDKAEQAMNVQGIMAFQGQLKQMNPALVTSKQLFNAATAYCQAVKVKDVDRYFTDPGDAPEPPPQPDPKMAELQAKAEIEKIQAQADIETQNRKTQAELTMMEREFELKRELAMLEFNLKQEESQRQRMTDAVNTMMQPPVEGQAEGEIAPNGGAALASELLTELKKINKPKKVRKVKGPDGPEWVQEATD